VSDDDEITETNQPRLNREARARLRGDLPVAEPGSIAEQFGYAPDEGHPLDAEDVMAAEAQRRADLASAVPEEVNRLRPALNAANERREWLQWRRSGMGASEIAALYGWGFENQSPYQVWAQKVGLIPAGDDYDSERMEFGRRAEPMLIQWFMDHTGLYVGSHQAHRTHAHDRWAIATIDGEVFEGPNSYEPLGGLELKTTSPFDWKPDAEVPLRYAVQAQWQMFVNEWPQVWFAVLHGTTFRVYELLRDEEDIAELHDKAGHFWHDHVLTAIPPDLDASPATTRALGQTYRGDRDRTTADLHELQPILTDLREAKAQIAKWEQTEAVLQNQLRAAMGNATYGDFGNGPEVTWSRFNKRTVDTKLLKLRFPDVYEIVAKAKPSSTFRVSGEKEETD